MPGKRLAEGHSEELAIIRKSSPHIEGEWIFRQRSSGQCEQFIDRGTMRVEKGDDGKLGAIIDTNRMLVSAQLELNGMTILIWTVNPTIRIIGALQEKKNSLSFKGLCMCRGKSNTCEFEAIHK